VQIVSNEFRADDLRAKQSDLQLQKEKARCVVLEIMKVCNHQEIPIVLVNFSEYWELTNGNGTVAIPAEVGLTAFSVKNGLYDNFSSLIDPGSISKV